MTASTGVRASVVLFVAVACWQASATGRDAQTAVTSLDSVGRAPAAARKPATDGPDAFRPMLVTYCVSCHNSRANVGGLALDGLDLRVAANDALIWEKVLRKLRGHLMPPPGLPQPSQYDVDSFVAWMEKTLDSHVGGPRAGHVPIQRLNRTEYAASVKALVGVDVNAQEILPQDVRVEGLDNIASALTVSPAFLDQYVTAARHIARLAVGDPNPRVANVKYAFAANEDPELPLPPGTRDGIRVTHNFPTDGEYRINILSFSLALYSSLLENVSTLLIMIDGRVVFRQTLGGPEDQALVDRLGADGRARIMERFTKIPVQVPAGVHDVAVAFVERARVETGENIGRLPSGLGSDSFRMARLSDGIEIVGPYNPTGVSRTRSRALIFICDPGKTGEAACAKQITENLARRAFRRPSSADDVASLLSIYEAGRANGAGFDQGVEQVVAAVLASPDFLFRTIRGPRGTRPDTEFTLTDLELASRLSFFLWNTGPDEELLTLATAGRLSKPGAADAQVRRMLADPRASSLVSSFAMKWLDLADLDSLQPDPVLFPGFTRQLRDDFAKEAERFIGSILLEGRSVVELLTANRTFVNDRLARHYGISGVTGRQFREVALEDASRFGLLGKAAILMKTSYPDRTSPVLRGAWVLDKLQGTPPTPPPPDATTNLAQIPGEQPKTVRARLEMHRDKPACKQCHGVIDPTGLALENFDAVGQWRMTDRQAVNARIDASAVLPNGVPINGPTELRVQVAARPSVFVRALTEKLLMYAVNRRLEHFDMPQVRAIVDSAAKDNYTLSSIVLGIVRSDAFRKQGRVPAPHEIAVQAAGVR